MNLIINSVTDLVTGSAVDFATDTVVSTVVGKEYSTKRQLSFMVGEGVQLTAVKDFHLSVLS